MSQITVLDKNNAPAGPFTRAEIAQKLQHGEIAPTDLAFVEGLSEWTPLQQVLAKVDAASPPAVSAPVASAPATGGYSYAATMAPPSHLTYAGFWLRFVAYLIDIVIVSVVVMIIAVIIGFIFGLVGGMMGISIQGAMNTDSGQPNATAMILFGIMELVVWAVTLVLMWLYFAKLESGPSQATLGKRVMGLQVTDMAGARLTFARATGRFFSKIVSNLTFLIGYIMAAFTERKQALHDMIAGTLVVRK